MTDLPVVPIHCDDCGLDFEISIEDHHALCEARACGVCGRQFQRPVPVTQTGDRVCYDCQRTDELNELYDAEEDGEDLYDGAS